ncbi:MAG TPA: glucan biosynthesis protein D [Steroidobacteraceae bacterium]|nr:glucan biosynthesis protein D [Steroidobacteraceae bacterium]
MSRRRFLRAGVAAVSMALPFSWALRSEAATAPRRPKERGTPQPFDYARLKGLARTMADAPYRAPPDRLPPAVAQLDWDHWQSIRFRDEHSIWATDGLRFRVQFAHLGFRINKPVRMYLVEDGTAQEIAFDPAMYDYSRAGISPSQLPPTLGFAGFRVYFHTDWTRDCAAFQGASYFRAVDGQLQYGMSERGLAIDCGMSTPEEFPDFIAYYLERPQKDSSRLTVYGLLDSPSTAGAYRFIIDVNDTLVMDIDSALYPRKQIERLGIAPGTSMFFCGKNDRHASEDWRPEIHDSDGLQLWNGAGEWLWRPLTDPTIVRVNSFTDSGPRGFGLMQRERDFAQYQDDGVFYDRRPSVWTEPKSNWGKGSVMLVEIPTQDETMDNIVAFWTPADKPQRGQEYLFGYRLYWCRENPFGPALATVRATYTGIGGIVGQKRTHFSWRFVVDFAGGDLTLLGEAARVTPVIWASRGRVEIVSARPLAPLHQWRAMFDLALTDDSLEPINLRLFLSVDGQALSETWLYQYVPPPPDQRRL